MQAPSIPDNEQQRLKELYRYAILDTDTEKDFEELVQLASQICNVPMSLVSLVDAERQWFKARVGLAAPETERRYSFCAHAILQDGVFEVKNALEDQRFFDNPLVTGEPNIRFYAGMPLVTDTGYKLGTLCILDTKPRTITPEQEFALQTLARQVITLMDLRLRNKELTALNATQTRLISIVAHDVRNPLASLKGIIELRQTDIISEEEANEMLKLASGQLDATIEMVANLIDWGKLQMRKGNAHLKEIDLHKTIQKDINEHRSLIESKHITIEKNIPDPLPCMADETAVHLVVRNLLSNAIKYTEDGVISITANCIDDKIKIEVTDTGIGMDEETLNSLFKQFKHYPVPGTRNEPGSGLGLSLLKDHIDSHEGSLEIRSEKNKGTTVTVIF